MLKLLLGEHRDVERDVFERMWRQRRMAAQAMDEFDRDDTVYLISLDAAGQPAGSVRLINTATPHMLSGPYKTIFPNIGFASPVIWEATRFVLPEAADARMATAFELLVGMRRFALDNGVRRYVSVYGAGLTPVCRRCGLIHLEIGRHRPLERDALFVGLFEVSESIEVAEREVDDEVDRRAEAA